MSNIVWVDMLAGKCVRIFKVGKVAVREGGLNGHTLAQMEKAQAVSEIRHAVFARDEYKCTHCGADVTWEGFHAGHMHEKIWRGRGGEQSVSNCVCLCYDCHLNDPVAGHGNRKPQWSNRA